MSDSESENEEDLNDSQRRILKHLRQGVQRGRTYFKSKNIAKATDLSPKQVGVNLGILKENCDDLDIEKWGYSTSTTWKVDRREANPN